MTRIKFTPPLKNGINQHEMIIQRVSCPTSLRSWDSSTCQFQCATLLKLESLIPLRFGDNSTNALNFATLVFSESHG